ncbi:MAG: outer membrane protein assembly factor BamE [Planctomycetes bacterium]|nr:outer membrane protein assembly factor BamE [Planctomycetota bacterium]
MGSIKGLARALAIGVFCVVLWGCANPNVTRENYEKIHKGMPMEQVEAILGNPSWRHKDKCYYKGKYGRIKIEVEDGCVDDIDWDD